eukprot:3163576-Amphidinium_carterae.1
MHIGLGLVQVWLLDSGNLNAFFKDVFPTLATTCWTWFERSVVLSSSYFQDFGGDTEAVNRQHRINHLPQIWSWQQNAIYDTSKALFMNCFAG